MENFLSSTASAGWNRFFYEHFWAGPLVGLLVFAAVAVLGRIGYAVFASGEGEPNWSKINPSNPYSAGAAFRNKHVRLRLAKRLNTTCADTLDQFLDQLRSLGLFGEPALHALDPHDVAMMQTGFLDGALNLALANHLTEPPSLSVGGFTAQVIRMNASRIRI